MKSSRLLAGVSLALVTTLLGPATRADDAAEQEIRKVDRAERDAVLARDLPAIERAWADDFIVNAPNNQVLKGKKEAVELVRAGILDYASFERDVEAVLIHGETAILMGLETVKPRNKAPFAGQTVRRRFTNIWMKRDGRWQLTARQATVISHD